MGKCSIFNLLTEENDDEWKTSQINLYKRFYALWNLNSFRLVCLNNGRCHLRGGKIK